MNIEVGITRAATKTPKPAWLRLGFRPFFLGAGFYAVLSILLWMWIYVLGWRSASILPPLVWHAHEMIYGYGLAVIAGFLLTAVKNWTGHPTLNGYALLSLFLVWVAARIVLLPVEGGVLWLAAMLDNGFIVLLLIAVVLPVIKSRQWRNLAIMLKLLLLLTSNIVFYLGVAGVIDQGVHYGLYSGLYLILALIFTLGRRVIPFFIERGVGYPVVLRNFMWLDVGSMLLFLFFWIADLLDAASFATGVLAAALFVVHGIRLAGWHTPGIWRKPLLWVLYVAYAALVMGFALKALSIFTTVSVYLAVHAFAVGGIGLMTLGMMARVALGHTGRNVFDPPSGLFWIFLALTAGFVCRVILPMVLPQYYMQWIILAQSFWILAFGFFVGVYFPVLSKPRIDGQDG